MSLNLHNIFCYLSSDENFLSTVIETNCKEIEHKKNKKKGFNLMTNMVTEYIPLSPYETQDYSLFPNSVKIFLTPDHTRLGIKNIVDCNLNVINISFLNSINMLIRPDLYKLNLEDHTKNLTLLETYLCHVIQKNCQIDKIKNTKKVQANNKNLIKNLAEGKISHELVQTIINIFEINLLIFDLTKTEINFYWTKGHKYPYFNPFKNIHCMSYVQGNYEPVMPLNTTISVEQQKKMYIQILTNIQCIKCFPEINLMPNSMLYLSTWSMDSDSFLKISDLYNNHPKKTMAECFKDLVELEKK